MDHEVLYVGKYVTVVAETPQEKRFPFRRSIRSILKAANVPHVGKYGGTDVGIVGNTAITNYIAPSPPEVIESLKTSDNKRALFGYIYDYPIDYVSLLEELNDAVWQQ